MRQILIYTILIVSSVVSNNSYAQAQYNLASESDPEATALLNEVKNNVDQSTAYSLEYSLTIEYPGSAPESQVGKLLQKGDNYKIVLDDQSIYAYGETMWTHNIKDNEVLIDSREMSDGPAFSPTQMLDFYSTGDFVYTIFNTSPFNNGTLYYIEFKPLDDLSEYSKLRMTVLKDNNTQIQDLTIFNKDGSRFKFKIEELELNASLDDAIFAFQVKDHPNITVEDIRL